MYTSLDVLFSTENVGEEKKRTSLFVMRLPILFELPGFSLLSLYVSPALCLRSILACPHVTCPIYVGFRPTVLAFSFCSPYLTNQILKKTSRDLSSFLGFNFHGSDVPINRYNRCFLGYQHRYRSKMPVITDPIPILLRQI